MQPSLQFNSGVINSYASGIGGGSFMMIKSGKTIDGLRDEEGILFKKGDVVMIDCRETAPGIVFYFR